MAANHEKAGLGREPRRAESRNKHCEKGGVALGVLEDRTPQACRQMSAGLPESAQGRSRGLKPGQTIQVNGYWATLTYLVTPDLAIVTFDDDVQRQVVLADLQTVNLQE